MRYSILVVLIVLSGCSTSIPPVYIPVYTPPNIIMPDRPVLRSDASSDIGVLTKNIELDLIDLKTYSIELENILSEFASTNTQINK